MNNSLPAAARPRPIRLALRLSQALLLVLVCLLALAACAGMSKPELAQRLQALEKNQDLVRAGLSSVRGKALLDGQEFELEMPYVRLAASDAARAAGARPMVLIHGTPSTLFNWALLLDAPGSPQALGDFDVYLPEIVGHGINPTAASPYTFQRCSDSIVAFLELLDLRDVTLVGHSYGGEFAWRAALDAPERVSRLVLIDSSGFARADGEWLPEEEALRELSLAKIGWLLNSKERVRPALQLHFEQPIGEDQLEEMVLCCDNPSNWWAMTDLVRDENGTRAGELSQLRQPTLLIFGQNDQAYQVESWARRFESVLPAARLAVVPDAGHYPHEERAAAVRELLRAFHLEQP